MIAFEVAISRDISLAHIRLSELKFYSEEGIIKFQDIEEENDRQKRVAAEAAIEERKKEVEAELGEQLKERSKEHEKHKYQEHEESFKALLIDLVSPTARQTVLEKRNFDVKQMCVVETQLLMSYVVCLLI